MNDPHVKALYYRVVHAKNVDYSNAKPLTHEASNFRIRIENNVAEIEMVGHYAAENSARGAVEPFLLAWEMRAALDHQVGVFKFVFDKAIIVDRDPPPGHVIYPETGRFEINAFPVNVVFEQAAYPEPPVGLMRDASVDLMFDRYVRYYDDRTTLADAGYYCLTVLETCGGRKAAVAKFSVDVDILRKIGDLTSTKGGADARKAEGAASEYSPKEKRWLEEAIKKLILRAAQVAADADAVRRQINMADLPEL